MGRFDHDQHRGGLEVLFDRLTNLSSQSFLLLGGAWDADSAGRTPKGGGTFRVDGEVRTTWKDFAK